MKFYYEILLSNGQIEEKTWQKLLDKIQKLVGYLKSFLIQVVLDQNTIHYYLMSPVPLSISINLESFLLKALTTAQIEKLQALDQQKTKYRGLKLCTIDQNLADLIIKYQTKERYFDYAIIKYHGRQQKYTLSIVYHERTQYYCQNLLGVATKTLLAINFKSAKQFYFQKIPKIMSVKKLLPHLKSNQPQLLEVETYPITHQTSYLSHQDYDFYRHSLVIGSSGSGKSKFLSLLIRNIFATEPDNLKIILIDPHDAVQDDLSEVTSKSIIDFQSPASSISLFDNFLESTNVYVDLMLTLFKGLIKTSYNFYLERLLRFSIYLLALAGEFQLINLRKLLLDPDFRKNKLREVEDEAPTNVITFFLQDFSELKNQHYDQAFAPLIALIDELQMTPVFNQEKIDQNFSNVISENFLTIFSLNRNILGEQTVQTIAGLLMQQIFTFAPLKDVNQKVIVIIDEIALIENPILPRFLSELRKYNVFAILAGQYFNQVSTELKNAIFANVCNFYSFRVSEMDARILTENLDIKIDNGEKDIEKALLEKQKLLSTLKNRECLVRIMHDGALIPVFKAKTVNFSPPRVARKQHAWDIHAKLKQNLPEYNFIIDTNINLKELMQATSSSRRKINHE